MIEIILIIGFVIFLVYNTCMIVINRGVPESISETSYICKNKYGFTWPFTVFCIAIAVTLFPQWVTTSPEPYQFLTFLSCSGIIFAGCSPLFKKRYESRIHYTSGIIAFVSAMLWCVLISNWTALISIFVVGGIWTCFQKHKYTYIFETVGYISIVWTLIGNYIIA